LRELFEFCITLGVGTNTYVSALLDFAGVYVMSSQRQLRFAAFGIVNKLPEDCPLTKVAVIKRAYRKEPKHGCCPNPESTWTSIDKNFLNKLETILRYFHVDCEAQFSRLPASNRLGALGNIDVVLTDCFFSKATAKPKPNEKAIEAALLAAPVKYIAKEEIDCPEVGGKKWINFKTTPAVADAAAVAEPCAAPRIITLDEESGKQHNSQLEFVGPPKAEKRHRVDLMPWKEWFTLNDTGSVESDMAVTVMVLQCMHGNFDPSAARVEIYMEDGQLRVNATQDLAEGDLWLPCCVPKQSKVYQHTEHAFAVPITVSMTKEAEQDEAAASPEREGNTRKRTFFAIPEWKVPKQRECPTEDNSAAAATPAVAVTSTAGDIPAGSDTPAFAAEPAGAGTPAKAKSVAEAPSVEWAWGPLAPSRCIRFGLVGG
jgi:hypothetical protein